MKQHLQGFASGRVFVVGDVMLDRDWSGSSNRISPEAPVPVVRVEERTERPGGAANVALNIAALSAQACVAGVIGADESGASLERLLQSEPRITSLLTKNPAVPTITKLRIVSRHQQLIRLDFECALPEMYRLAPSPAVLAQLQSAHAVVLSDYGKGVLSQPQEFIKAAIAAGKPVLVDPKRRDFAAYAGASLITPNMSEFEAVVGRCADDNDLVTRARALAQEHALEALLVTRSEKGMSLVPRTGAPVHIPAQTREIYDVTGAGDTVIATLAVARACGLDWETAARIANIAAGIVVGKLGAATVSVPELRRALGEWNDTNRGILDEKELLQSVADARSHGETIVMTNGCFDILHAGHVRYLAQAKELGDRLIVAVNDDDSVRRLKGNPRPIVPLRQRMEVLAALGAVDWVVPFSEDTPERLISQVRPDVLVKGGDYKPEQIAGHKSAGEVRVLEFVEGHSTSRIIDQVQKLGKP